MYQIVVSFKGKKRKHGKPLMEYLAKTYCIALNKKSSNAYYFVEKIN